VELCGLYCSVHIVRRGMRLVRHVVDECRNAYRVFDTCDGKRMLGRPRHRREIIKVR